MKIEEIGQLVPTCHGDIYVVNSDATQSWLVSLRDVPIGWFLSACCCIKRNPISEDLRTAEWVPSNQVEWTFRIPLNIINWQAFNWQQNVYQTLKYQIFIYAWSMLIVDWLHQVNTAVCWLVLQFLKTFQPEMKEINH